MTKPTPPVVHLPNGDDARVSVYVAVLAVALTIILTITGA